MVVIILMIERYLDGSNKYNGMVLIKSYLNILVFIIEIFIG